MILSNRNRDIWGSPDFWQGLCPELTIGRQDVAVASPSSTILQSKQAEECRLRLIKDGYATIDEPVIDASLTAKLLGGIQALQQPGSFNEDKMPVKLPASFVLLFDETWELARISKSILKQSTHAANEFNYDILAWFIETGGFSPHRDRQPENVMASFHHKDMQAKFVTQWIALSEAQPENSCLYVIPKWQDPGYINGDDGPGAEDPLRRALPAKDDFQHIRAIPRSQGQSLVFTHRIIHWGSARNGNSKMPPRVAISFVCSDPSYEKPYIDPKYFTDSVNPPFHIRLLLVCAQLLIYYQRFELPKETIKACYDYCKEYEDELEKAYRQKVYLEFVKAMKEAKETAVAEKIQTNAGESHVKERNADEDGGGNDEEEDEEDAMMEEMLIAEEQGYGEFEDDYEDTLDDASDNIINNCAHEAGDDEEDDSDTEEEGVSLFGSFSGNGHSPKRRKVNL